MPKVYLKSIFQKLFGKGLFSDLKGIIQNPISICFMQIKALGQFICFFFYRKLFYL
jgi:hypothetical protein